MFHLEADTEITEDLILKLISRHRTQLGRYNRCKDYYLGKHAILNTVKRHNEPNNKPVTNHAWYITTTQVGYFMGNPITISSKSDKDITDFIHLLEDMKAHIHNADLARDISIYGTGYELLYSNEDGELKLAILDPRNTFVVFTNTIEEKSLFAVYYIPNMDADGQIKDYTIYIYTTNEIITYRGDFSHIREIARGAHFFKKVPITQYFNNLERLGDFEGVISLIDCYNKVTAERVNEREKYTNSLLLIKGAELEDGEDANEINRHLKNSRILELPHEGADANYLTKSSEDSDAQTLSDDLKTNIHDMSCTPNFSDENFAGNVSGVAMQFKLIHLENLAKIKERFFINGLERRFKLMENYLKTKASIQIDAKDIKITLVRTLPVNNYELSQTVKNLVGMVPTETLIAQFNFIEDPKREMDKLKKEKDEDTEREIRANSGLVDSFEKTNFDHIGG